MFNASIFAESNITSVDAEGAALLLNSQPSQGEAGWSEHPSEGQLSVDVFETEDNLIIVAPMAGTRPADLSIHVHSDFLTIRGVRHAPGEAAALGTRHFYQECFWGPFSRTIVLPVHVRGELAQSEFRQGVLTIKVPKVKSSGSIPLLVIEE